MLDLSAVVMLCLFFVVALLYVSACDSLKGKRQ